MASIFDILNMVSTKFSHVFGAFRTVQYDSDGNEVDLATSIKQDEIITKLNTFATSDIDEASATVTYIGKMDADGAWLIMKIDESTNPTALTYATVLNNPTLTSYALGWAGRTTATYGTYAEVF